MKRNHQARRKAHGVSKRKKQRSRAKMHRFLRRFLIFTLILILVAVGIAWLSETRPLTAAIPRQTLQAQKDARIQYEVRLNPETFGDRDVLPMDQIYLSETVDSIAVDFRYQLSADRETVWNTGHQVNARVEIRDAESPEQVLLSQNVNLLRDQQRQQSRTALIEESVLLDFAEYEAIAASFTAPADVNLLYTLTVQLTVLSETMLAGGPYIVVDEPALRIPLQQPRFSIDRVLPRTSELSVTQPVRYQLMLIPLPFAVYPSAAGVALLLLIIVLAMTQSRPKNKYQRQLRRMLRKARSRLMVIGDKAWEPEWCIRATHFKSMVKTAKKLRHPVFCYIDDAAQTAYFYVYYGENNYCFIFGENEASAQAISTARPEKTPVSLTSTLTDEDDDADMPIPVLPESDTGLPGEENTPEIMLARLRVQTSHGR